MMRETGFQPDEAAGDDVGVYGLFLLAIVVIIGLPLAFFIRWFEIGKAASAGH